MLEAQSTADAPQESRQSSPDGIRSAARPLAERCGQGRAIARTLPYLLTLPATADKPARASSTHANVSAGHPQLHAGAAQTSTPLETGETHSPHSDGRRAQDDPPPLNPPGGIQLTPSTLASANPGPLAERAHPLQPGRGRCAPAPDNGPQRSQDATHSCRQALWRNARATTLVPDRHSSAVRERSTPAAARRPSRSAGGARRSRETKSSTTPSHFRSHPPLQRGETDKGCLRENTLSRYKVS